MKSKKSTKKAKAGKNSKKSNKKNKKSNKSSKTAGSKSKNGGKNNSKASKKSKNKNKKTVKKSKQKNKKKVGKKSSKKVGKSSKKTGEKRKKVAGTVKQASCLVSNCLDLAVYYIGLVRTKVTYFQNQNARLAKQNLTAQGKAAKKLAFLNSLNQLVTAGGGNMTNLVCSKNNSNPGILAHDHYFRATFIKLF